jgi:uncharacterized protein (DUF952 family)
MIYHVTTQREWDFAQASGKYSAPSLAAEGFIHCSTKEQVAGVLDRYYKNKQDLILLHLEETKITSPLNFELAPSVNEMFPHIFGTINIDAVVKTEKL